ncbi:AP endonuclease, family 2 superfamily [Candidatus Vecturithrix granuli]|uniref:AP endonuclease, family 2 superfamily n=1 Tax=Vecturithrix granuli TaxID=1499967 RepID=A0A081C9B0_VECG1|nr:AP endonuclease, family 2 superfamily [Candidatus Vecturithrix granuli]
MKPVICIEPLYPDLSPTEKIARIASFGFKYIEFWNWRDKDIPSLLNACSRHQVQVVNFSGHRVGSPAAKETHHLFLQDLADAVATAKQLDCHKLMLLTNALNPDGSVTDAFDQIPDDEKCTNIVLGLKKALEAVPEDIDLVLEPLNILIDHPGYFLKDMETAAALIHDVNNPRLKILCDLYHLGVMGSDLQHVISDFIQGIGYFHIADFPGRHEPGTGSADWPELLGLIKEKGYTGYVGFEYFPQQDSDASLAAIKQLWDAL